MKRNSIHILTLLLTLVALPTAVAIAAGSGVELQVTVQSLQEQISAEGVTERKLIEAETVVPGDEVIYTIHYVNHGDESADHVVITNAVPEHLNFRGESGEFPNVALKISVDGGHSYHSPDNLWVFAADGTKRPAALSDYTHIQWTLQESLLPGHEGNVGYLAQLK